MAQLPNKYGYFSDDGKTYIITSPQTPMPWINVLTNGDYGMVVSQAGSGYSWRTHASLNRITRWEQDLIRDEWGKYLYLRDAGGEFWSPTWQPSGTALDAYQVEHGFGYTTIESQRGTLASTVTYFVPLDAPCEVWLVRLENQGESPRQLQLFSYFEWLLGAAPDWHREFHRTFIDTWYNPEHGALLASKVLWELPIESKTHWNRSWPYTAFHSASLHPVGFDGDKRDFIGRNGSVHQPYAVSAGQSSNHDGRWGDAIASLQLELTLGVGQAQDIVFVVGAADSTEEALAIVERFKDPNAAHQALAAVRTHWQAVTAPLAIETPDPALNVLGNGWLQYQAIAGRLEGRSAYYQTGGAFGFRDQLQDSLVWLLLGKPERTLAQIRLHAAHQFQEGVVLHWWHPIAETGHRSDYSDDLLWLPFAVLQYIHETGDDGCLAEELPFYDGGSASLYEHCMAAFAVALKRRSPRGLPYILKGDWNDGLNAVGAEGRGESVWMAHFLHYLLVEWADYLDNHDATQATTFRQEAAALAQAVNELAWDGAWYWRASTDSGDLVGSHTSPEGQIFLNAQTWAVLSGTATGERAQLALQSARQRLYKEYGPLLLAPAYSVPNSAIGYLSRYAPGIRENGGVYCHAACWAVLAERQANGVQAAYEVWRSFCPAVRGQDPDHYSGEPYVMPGNVSGPLATVPGQAGWTWYTGSGAWYLRVLVEGVLGIKATYNGLQVDAGLPDGWEQFRVVRPFRSAIYDITIRRGQDSEAKGCWVDGAIWEGDALPIASDETTQQVEIIL
ncbi:MAG: glycosyl transferase family 36 [Anaerolineales bacterium]|nr:glycosyl transferase family 36 [Anaerolineales bacterium]